jgi:hypothetical protein
MTKLFTCLKGHEWEIAVRRPAYASDNWVVCPVCGGRPEDPPVELPDKVPPKPDPVIAEEEERPRPPAKGGGRSALLLFLGFLGGAILAGVAGFLAVRGVQAETNRLKSRLSDLERGAADKEKELEEHADTARSQAVEQRKIAEGQRDIAEAGTRKAKEERERFQHMAAHLALDRGLRLSRDGDSTAGLLWLARSLETTPATEKDTQQSLLRILGGMNSPLFPRRAFLQHPGEVLCVAISPDDQTLLTGCQDGMARRFDTATGKPVGDPLPHDGPVTAVAYSKDGKYLLTGSADKMARVWDANTGKVVGKPMKHDGTVLAVAFNPQGGTMLTGCSDKSARLWQMTTHEQMDEPVSHGGKVTAVAYSPNGKTLLTGSTDKTAQLWEAIHSRMAGRSRVCRSTPTAIKC